MNLLSLALQASNLLPEKIVAASFAMPINEEIGLGLACILTVLGITLHWQLPRQRMAVEEHMKDGTMTEAQAKRRLRFIGICAPIATIAGIILLLGMLLDYSN